MGRKMKKWRVVFEVGFSNPVDQETVMNKLQNKLLKDPTQLLQTKVKTHVGGITVSSKVLAAPKKRKSN